MDMLGQILVAFVGGVLALWAAVYTGKVELKKRKPETLTHNCRLVGFDVYTFIKGTKKQTPPLCPYLDASDSRSCRFEPKSDNHASNASKMKEVNKGQCYIALFTDKFDLE